MKVGDTVAAYRELIDYYDLPEECQIEATGSLVIDGVYGTQPSCFTTSYKIIEREYWYCVTLVSAPRESSAILFRGSYTAD